MSRAARSKIDKYYEAVAVGLLVVDPTLDAQRIFQRAWANKLTKIWDRDVLLPAIVSLREDGVYYVLDGQHSNAVAKEVEGANFKRDCMIYTGLSRQQEAKLFLAANRDRKPVKPHDNFRVAITAGDEFSIRVEQEVKSCGLEIGSGTSVNRVGAVQALIAIGAKREGLIPKVLKSVEGAWGRDTTTWDNMMLRAVGMVIDKNWDIIKLDRLSKTLQKAPVGLWKGKAITLTTSGGGSNSRSVPLARQIIVEYNRGLRGGTPALVPVD
ncbi:DUF6551 family protein [Streptomyces sp. NPDC047967]|uniref:DUF6551 family protein n=1 Tax=Streptomyces sp. NPDC047967 TaxID=3154924 RepID=UPI0033F2C8C6